MNHLRPSISRSGPSRRMRVWMLVASEEATSGSVIAKHDRISPRSSGASQRSYFHRPSSRPSAFRSSTKSGG
jgi:hypothetical protein